MPAIIVATANATHHHLGARSSTAPAIRSVSQLKLRLFNTSGTRASGRSTEVDASAAITSGAAVAPSTLRFLLRVQRSFVVLLIIVLRPRLFVFLRTGHTDLAGIGHLWIRIANSGQVTHARVDVQIFQQPVVPILLLVFRDQT